MKKCQTKVVISRLERNLDQAEFEDMQRAVLISGC